MFDTMTLTKIVGSVCGALLVFLLGKWAAESLYSTGGGHGDGHSQAYVIETGADESTGESDSGPSMFELMAAADVGKGEKVFGKCKACHKLEDGANSTGPYLYGVVGRPVDSAEGYSYSGALEKAAEVWTPETLSAFLENPKGYAPGTTMGFSGLKKPEDRANLIAYLDQLDGDTYEMEAPAEEAATEEAPAEEAAAQEATAAEATEMAAAEEPAAEEPAAEETAASEASGFAALVAAADVGKGEKVYKKCKACHKLEDGKNGVGPHLANLVGRPIAGVEGFKYSDALAGIGGDWTADQLSAWLESPKEFAPGNKMSFAGVRKEEDRAAVIAYIKANGG